MELSEADGGDHHYEVEVTKVPKGIVSAGITYQGSRLMRIDSEAFTPFLKKGISEQRTGVHESVHVPGLGDTYVDDSPCRSRG